MKKNKLMKAIALSFGLAVMTLTANNLNAQNDGNRGLFGRGGEIEYSNRESGSGMEWTGGGMVAQDPTEQAPLGSGLMLLMAASAGYAIVKSKSGKEVQQ